jgi:hypothetical protein
LPPRELRSTAILLTLTLRTVMPSVYDAVLPKHARPKHAAEKPKQCELSA